MSLLKRFFLHSRSGESIGRLNPIKMIEMMFRQRENQASKRLQKSVHHFNFTERPPHNSSFERNKRNTWARSNSKELLGQHMTTHVLISANPDKTETVAEAVFSRQIKQRDRWSLFIVSATKLQSQHSFPKGIVIANILITQGRKGEGMKGGSKEARKNRKDNLNVTRSWNISAVYSQFLNNWNDPQYISPWKKTIYSIYKHTNYWFVSSDVKSNLCFLYWITGKFELFWPLKLKKKVTVSG